MIKRKTAFNLAIKYINLGIRKLNIDANLYERAGADYPRAISASEERRKLKEAIAILEEIRDA